VRRCRGGERGCSCRGNVIANPEDHSPAMFAAAMRPRAQSLPASQVRSRVSSEDCLGDSRGFREAEGAEAHVSYWFCVGPQTQSRRDPRRRLVRRRPEGSQSQLSSLLAQSGFLGASAGILWSRPSRRTRADADGAQPRHGFRDGPPSGLALRADSGDHSQRSLRFCSGQRRALLDVFGAPSTDHLER